MKQSRYSLIGSALLLAGLAACGGGDGPTSNRRPTTAQITFNTQAVLASGTTGAQLRVNPSYESAGQRVALTPVTLDYGTGAGPKALNAQLELAGCLTETNTTCAVSAAVALVAGGRTIDSVFVGPINLQGGGTATQALSLAEVASIRVALPGGAAAGDPVVVPLGGTVALTATALDPNGAALTRPVAFASNAGGIAAVNGAGVLSGAAIGAARVTASAGGREVGVNVQVQAPLTVTVTGAGSVASAPGGIACTAGAAAGCSATFAPNAQVTLTATAEGENVFGGWGGGCSGVGECRVTLDAARSVTASFVPRRVVSVAVTVNSPGAGSVVVTGQGVAPNSTTTCAVAANAAAATCTFSVIAGVPVTLNGQPGTGSTGASWGGACTGTTLGQACVRSFPENGAVTATFGRLTPPDSIYVNAVSDPANLSLDGVLRVESTRNGLPTNTAIGLTLRSPSTAPGAPAEQSVGPLELDRGGQVTLIFTPNANSRLVSWGGACTAPVTDPTGTSACTFTASNGGRVTVTLAPR